MWIHQKIMNFFLLTFNLALFYWAYLLKSRVRSGYVEYTITTGTLTLVFVLLSIVMIAFRTIDVRNGVIYGGIDAPAYKMIFEDAAIDYIPSLIVQFYEPGYATLVWFFSNYVGSYEVYQLVIYSFLYYTLFFFVKQIRPTLYIFITLLLLSFMIMASLNIIRGIVAVFLGFYVLYFLNKNRFMLASFIALLGLSIHTSAIFLFIMIIFYFLHSKVSKVTYRIVYFLSFFSLLLISFFILPFVLTGTRLEGYGEYKAGEFSLNTFLLALIVTFLVFNRFSEFVRYCSFNRVLIIVLPTIFFVLPIFYNYSIGYRLLLYYLPIIFMLLPSIFYIYRFNLKRNLVYAPLVLALYLYVVIKIFIFFNVNIVNTVFITNFQ